MKNIILLFYYKLRFLLNFKLSCLIFSLKIKNTLETVCYITANKCSVSRFGDGEFAVMAGGYNGFQTSNELLARKLSEVFSNPIENHITCIPKALQTQRGLKQSSKLFILGFLAIYGKTMLFPFLNQRFLYFDTNFTRFYMPYKTSNQVGDYVKKLKLIWDKRDICIIEGRYSRLGVGNDLFSNAKNIIRIICPEKNAFESYDAIIEQAKVYGKDKLILIALGMTATVLAYDLAKSGFQAIDIGHVDIEYMWYKMHAESKCYIPGRYVNECGGIKEELNETILKEYRKQIVSIID